MNHYIATTFFVAAFISITALLYSFHEINTPPSFSSSSSFRTSAEDKEPQQKYNEFYKFGNAITDYRERHESNNYGHDYSKHEENHGQQPIPLTYLVGIVRNAVEITSIDFMVGLACNNWMPIHIFIVAGKGGEEFAHNFEKAVMKKKSTGDIRYKCGTLNILKEPSELSKIQNRIDRIAYLRDFQREHLRLLLKSGHDNDIVIVADLDLHIFPPIEKLAYEVSRMRLLHENDVLCSSGLMHRPYGYYDLYATVLYPDTFLYPISLRMKNKSWEGEDLSLVRSNDEFGEVTSWDILDYLEREKEIRSRQEKGKDTDEVERNPSRKLPSKLPKDKSVTSEDSYHSKSYFTYTEPSTAVPVRSCFGGLAIYSASTYLEPTCRYTLEENDPNASRLLKYANRDDRRPCEHVVFHDCLLRDADKPRSIAIMPNMNTFWNEFTPPLDRLISDSKQDSLITFFNQREQGDKLTSKNGYHILKINSDGHLVIESCELQNRSCWHVKVRYVMPPPQLEKSKKDYLLKTDQDMVKPLKLKANWSHMFLILEGNGNLILLKQVPRHKLKNNGKNCASSPTTESCQLEVWSSQSAIKKPMFSLKRSQRKRYELVLENDGSLQIQERSSDMKRLSRVLWRNNVMSE